MKKGFYAVFVVSILFGAGLAGVYADNPAPSGERIFLLGYPDFISGAASSSGGPIFDAGPWSIHLNPALTANLQRFAIDVGYTGIANTSGINPTDDLPLGSAFHLGALLPTPIGVWTVTGQFEFMPAIVLGHGNMAAGRIGWSRDILKNLYLGASIWVGAISRYGDAFGLGVDLGAVYRLGNLSFLRDVRVSAVVANMGQNFKIDYFDGFPSVFAPKIGVAALLLDKEKIKVGLSSDLALPLIGGINFIFDVGAQVKFLDMITVSAGWGMNARELDNSFDNRLPHIGIAFNWTSETGKNEALRKRGFEKSDFIVSAAWQRVYENMQLFSAGTTIHFGQPDTEGPDIELGEAK